jgi:hypothetical protein
VLGEPIHGAETGGGDEDAEPATDGPRVTLAYVDADSRVADRSRLGRGVGLDRMVHDVSSEWPPIKVISLR